MAPECSGATHLRPVEPPDHPEAEPGSRQLHPLPRGLVELYGLLAVLFVLMPEWLAGSALGGFREQRRGAELPVPSMAWQRLPELRLATLSLAQLRQLAGQMRLANYGGLDRETLSGRLLRRLRRRLRPGAAGAL